QAYSTAFTGAGGVAPYSYAVTAGALPAGLTLATDGILSGTPTAGGAFSFTVTATDSSTGAGPYTASQTVALTVNGSTIAVTPTALTDGVRGVAYSQSVTAAGGVAPYTYTIASGALPAGLTLSPQGVIAGTPTVTGSFTFNVRATDSATGAGPYQGVATVTLTVSAAAITVTPTTLPEVLAGTAFSQQMQAAGGQGGYTYAVTSGGLPTGLTLTSGGLLSGRPQISGVFNFTITARDAFGNTGVAALALTVNGRPDPSADADVRGLSQAQGEAARRMAETQIDNFHRRLEALHSAAGDRPVDLNLNLDGGAFSPLDQSQVVNSELAQATGQYGLGQDRDLAGRQELARMMDARRPEASVSTAVPGPANGSVQTGGLRVWAGGAISLGERDAIDQTAELRIHTSGVSAGVDMRITDTLDLGLGAGFGQERTEVGEADSQMDADSWVGVAYGSWRPAEHIFFDGLLGYGEMSFDLRRRTLVDDSLVTGDRDGSTWFGSISAGVDRTFGPTRWIGYGRLEKQAATLDAYAETGSAVWALSYDARDLDSLQGALGVRYERLFDRRDYSLTPGMRVEWRKEFSEGGAQSLRYADWLDLLAGLEGRRRLVRHGLD
ncbi:MAG: autotransporter domain-containing protein, partial [Brevundimonas sp.]